MVDFVLAGYKFLRKKCGICVLTQEIVFIKCGDFDKKIICLRACVATVSVQMKSEN